MKKCIVEKSDGNLIEGHASLQEVESMSEGESFILYTDLEKDEFVEILEEDCESVEWEKEEIKIEKPEVEKPSLSALKGLFPSGNTAINRSETDRGLHCKKWAKENNFHFVGFCVKTGEPIFKVI